MNAKDRFYSKKWGVFNHFLYAIQNDPNVANSRGIQTDWDTLVNGFDAGLLAENLHRVGAGYYVITVMQGTKYMIAPNAAFDAIAGTKPGEACSTRDLVADLAEALDKYGIDLFLYFTGDGPYASHPEGDRFGFVSPRRVGVTREFVGRWASVLGEYALRYGDRVKGWWIDGCYKDYFKYTDELLEIYYKACKKGNPDALVALNNGVGEKDIIPGYSFEDFICGEQTDFKVVPKERFYGGAQAHVLAPLGVPPHSEGKDPDDMGPGWGCFGLKRGKEYVADYVRRVNAAGGVVSLDVGVYRDGGFSPEQLDALEYVGKNV